MSMNDRAIRVKELRKQYPGRDGPVQAVDGIDLEIAVGECFGLLGPNGAGKTTTVEILEGLNRPTSGEVEVLGRQWATDAAAIRERIGVTLQETRFPDKETVRELLTVFRSFYRSGMAIDEAIASVSLESKANSSSSSSPAASSSGSPSPSRWSATPSCSSSTSRRRASTPSRGASSGT